MKIAIVGTGYVGLVTGAGLADFGNDVTCVDVDERKIERLRGGEIPIYEPGLDLIVDRNLEQGRLRFTTDIGEALQAANVIFIAVGTPPKEDGSADLTYVKAVAESIAVHARGPAVVVTKSTVPVGTGRMLRKIFVEAGQESVTVASNPEFLREGSAIEDFLHPDRVVIGADDEDSIRVLKRIYQPLHALDVPFVVTNLESAELIKYASNAFLATKITFINEIATLSEKVGADVQDVAKGMGLDDRIGPRFLQAGPGYGGSCFPKDTKALADVARSVGCTLEVVESVIDANERVKLRMVGKVRDALGGDLSDRTIAVLGLSFKPDTDDVRDSPTIPLIDGMLGEGAEVRAFDPQAMPNSREVFGDRIVYTSSAYEAAEGADAVVIATEWNEFRAMDPIRLGEKMKQRLLIDLRNLYDGRGLAEAGFTYVSVGRPGVSPVLEPWRQRAIRA